MSKECKNVYIYIYIYIVTINCDYIFIQAQLSTSFISLWLVGSFLEPGPSESAGFLNIADNSIALRPKNSIADTDILAQK